MNDPGSRLEQVTDLYVRQDRIARDLGGDLGATAGHWLDEAEADLDAVEPAISAGRYRVAYNAAYDIYRHAAEAVVHVEGIRLHAGRGAHEVTFELASAAMDGRTDVFDNARSSTMRMTRNGLEYLDADRPTEVTEADARWALELARQAVVESRSSIDERSG